MAFFMPAFTASAQYIDDVKAENLGNPKELVDELLKPATPIGTIKSNGTKIFYAKEIQKALSEYEAEGGYGAWRTIIETINGREVQYLPYVKPYIYYVIAEIPGEEGTFYGFYTTGFNNIVDVQCKSRSELHPKGFERPLYGVFVRPDGTRSRYVARSQAELKKDKLKAPAGKYFLTNHPNFKNLEFTFNAGGTGTVRFNHNRHRHQAVTYMAGESATYHHSGPLKGRRKGTARRFTGGYHFFLYPYAIQPMKWKMAENGNIEITFTGKPTINVPGEVDAETEFANMTITASDMAIEKSLHRQDFPTNEDVLREKENWTEVLKEQVAQQNSFVLTPYHIGKNQIIIYTPQRNGVNGYNLLGKAEKSTVYDKSLTEIPDFVKTYASNREYGAMTLGKRMKKNIQRALPSAGITSYKVTNLNPITGCADIEYVKDGARYTSALEIDQDGHLNAQKLRDASVEDNSLTNLCDNVKANDEKIMAYKKDKRRSKIVKEYEKKYKKISTLANPIFSDIDSYYSRKEDINSVLKMQNEYLQALE